MVVSGVVEKGRLYVFLVLNRGVDDVLLVDMEKYLIPYHLPTRKGEGLIAAFIIIEQLKGMK